MDELKVSYQVVDGTGQPTLQEASGEFKTQTILIDSTAALSGSPTGVLPAGTLLAPDSGVGGRYLVLDESAIGVTQNAEEAVLLPHDLFDVNLGNVSVAGILVGQWTKDRAQVNNGPLGAANKAKFDQRLILRWDGD